MNYKRPVYNDIHKRLLAPESLIQVISGPRQVGKTTLVQQLFQSNQWEGIYHVVDNVSQSSAWIESAFNAAVLKEKQSNKPIILAFDEIQKISNWSEIIKKLYDQQKFRGESSVRLILLGSSNWLMQKGLSESLAGRFEQWNLGHWTYNELQAAFNVSPEEYVYFGAYPGAINMIKEESRWKNYILASLIETVITKDVLMMQRIDKPAVLRRVFELGSSYSGQILSYTKLLGQLQDAKNTTTVAHYLELLAQAGLLTGLQKFAMDNARKRSSSPKWQVMNNALLSAQSSGSFATTINETKIWGRWVESAVGCHFLSHQREDLEIFYWNASNAEVDFILKKENQYIAIEVKLSQDKVSGMSEFTKSFNPTKVYQLSDKGLSWKEMITLDPRDLF
jgi:predicted AAA+ superfamily ATPase